MTHRTAILASFPMFAAQICLTRLSYENQFGRRPGPFAQTRRREGSRITSPDLGSETWESNM
jgi:hypothetical protein